MLKMFTDFCLCMMLKMLENFNLYSLTSVEDSSWRDPPSIPVAHEIPRYQSLWRTTGYHESRGLGFPISRASNNRRSRRSRAHNMSQKMTMDLAECVHLQGNWQDSNSRQMHVPCEGSFTCLQKNVWNSSDIAITKTGRMSLQNRQHWPSFVQQSKHSAIFSLYDWQLLSVIQFFFFSPSGTHYCWVDRESMEWGFVSCLVDRRNQNPNP